MNGERELWNPKFVREREGFDVKSGEDRLEICWVVKLQRATNAALCIQNSMLRLDLTCVYSH